MANEARLQAACQHDQPSAAGKITACGIPHVPKPPHLEGNSFEVRAKPADDET